MDAYDSMAIHRYSDPDSLPISLLRQTDFCPRIPFLCETAHIRVPETSWVKQGVENHKRIERIMKRRTMERFGLKNPVAYYRCRLSSKTYGLHGIADLLLIDESNVMPIEFKLRMRRITSGTKAQLLAYGLAAEEQFDRKFKKAAVISIETDKILLINVNEESLSVFNRLLKTLHGSVSSTFLPDSPAGSAKCGQCEFLKFCNDRE